MVIRLSHGYYGIIVFLFKMIFYELHREVSE